MRKWLVGTGICAGVLAASAVMADDAVERSYRMDVVLAADGSVQQVQPGPQVPEVVAGLLQDRISSWQFEPGSVDGVPAVTETSVMVRLRAEPDPAGSDGIVVKVMDARVGAVTLETSPPRYPASALRSNRQGTVVMAVEVGGDGRVIEARPYEHAPAVDRSLTRAALSAVADWTFKPERVAGQGVPATVLVPVCFTLHSQGVDRSTPPGTCQFSLSGDADGPMLTETATLQPVARLLVDPTAESTGG